MQKKIIKLCTFCLSVINDIIPKKDNKIIFYSSPDFSDNARAIYNCMRRKGLIEKYEVIWVVKNVDKLGKTYPYVKFVKHKGFRNCMHFLRSKYIIRTHSFMANVYSVKKQVMVVAWHGMPLKDITPYKDGRQVPGDEYSYLNVTSKLFRRLMAQCLSQKEENNVIVGLPRNDDLFHSGNIKELMGLEDYEKIIIWMPTFRDSRFGHHEGVSNQYGLPGIKSLNDFISLNNILKKNNYCLLLKLHHWAAKNLNDLKYDYIKNITEDDIPKDYTLYNLLGATDVLLTDYSSVYIDYLLLDRPIGFIFDDLEEYENSRGFLLNPYENYTPGKKMLSCEELCWFIDHIQEDSFKKKREELQSLFHRYVDDRSSERLLETIGIL